MADAMDVDVDAREEREEREDEVGREEEEEEMGDVVLFEEEGEEKERKEETALGLEEMELVKKVGFARLKGVEGSDIDYLVKKYEIFIGRKSKSTPVDVVLGNSMSISRKHAKISYNFDTRNWELTILGKNGVSVGKILYAPSSPPVVLHSQDLLQFGDKLEPVSLYFLLPLKERA